MPPANYTRIVLQERPEGDITNTTFRTEVVPFDLKPKDDEVLVRVTWLSLDPAMRGWIRDVRSYLPPVQIGDVMRALGLGVVIEAGKESKFKVGEHVRGMFGWTEYAVLDDKNLEKNFVNYKFTVSAPEAVLELDFLNTLGPSGLTAYFGLKDIGKLKAGEVLVVSGAAGSVGSLACQLGKRNGAKVYAIAGSSDKCEWLEKEIGVDKAFNYKEPSFKNQLKKMPYVDVFFDNVGGEILDTILTRLNRGARVVICGAISQYNYDKPTNIVGLQNYMTLISQRARMEGFVVFDYQSQYQEAMNEMAGWLADGSVKRKFHIVEGLESAPTALPMLYTGGNTGKLVVKVSDETVKL